MLSTVNLKLNLGVDEMGFVGQGGGGVDDARRLMLAQMISHSPVRVGPSHTPASLRLPCAPRIKKNAGTRLKGLDPH